MRPVVRHYTGFAASGVVVGSASIGMIGDSRFGWTVWIVGSDPIEVAHEHEAIQELRNAGAVSVKSSEGIKR